MANPVAARPASYVATVVAITTEPLLDETSLALQTLRARTAVRTILITLGNNPQPPVDRTDDATTIHELLPQFVNNAVAALRLSSLPSLAWWRHPEADLLGEIARLVDRIVLDVPDPALSWEQARKLRDHTSFSDVRWTRLTRWRSLMAQFFDLPDLRSAAASFTTLEITATDVDAARLFGAWMRARFSQEPALRVSISRSQDGHAPLTAVTLRSDSRRLDLRVLPNHTCVRTAIERDGKADTVRVVPLGNMTHVALLAEEMRVRSRDVAFEQALAGVDAI